MDAMRDWSLLQLNILQSLSGLLEVLSFVVRGIPRGPGRGERQHRLATLVTMLLLSVAVIQMELLSLSMMLLRKISLLELLTL